MAKKPSLPATYLQQLNELEDRLRIMTERSADTRDNIVHMRERIRDLREQRKYLSAKLEEADEQHVVDLARNQAYVEGMLRVHEQTVSSILSHRMAPITVSIQEPKPMEADESGNQEK